MIIMCNGLKFTEVTLMPLFPREYSIGIGANIKVR